MAKLLATSNFGEIMTLHDIESTVKNLSDDELTVFARWFEEYLSDAWDRRIEEDIAAG